MTRTSISTLLALAALGLFSTAQQAHAAPAAVSYIMPPPVNMTASLRSRTYDSDPLPRSTPGNTASQANAQIALMSALSHADMVEITSRVKAATAWMKAGPARTRYCGVRAVVEPSTAAEESRLVRLKQAKLERQAKQNGHSLQTLVKERRSNVPIAFHVVHDGAEGKLEAEVVQLQVDVLNTDYADYGFRFTLTNLTYTDNALWYRAATSGSDVQDVMKAALRQGGADMLNLYSVSFEADPGLLGYATFPSSYKNAPSDDGVVFLSTTVPGGKELGFNQGKTVTHEVGHWLGLYHTFQGGCTGLGDGVADTPPQASPTSGCPVSRDSCPGDDFKDMTNNYMDYSSDECLTALTQGQAIRMAALSAEYRGL